ncbi:uncharacterized protein BJ171DRAFT_574220 [Polychytrium aggregatum]|uniref:uncharacterized protein n=1 Tax=Polychytrium aggregatum TaxID=110093 RepID=UPI0022FEBCFB|nr:uncharacterized protein BJ171DRAFT_574220 [Polychytrium aggregatum]KAI9190792.1 hypothetical protein BJ171DRAFT_574220 [Polychytrium aggregatum]
MKATSILEQLANEGHSDRKSVDRRMAFEWYSKSASQGNSNGQWMDYTKAVEWYRKSAEQGNRYGQDYLGLCYQVDAGVPEDANTAVFWYRKSTEQGFRYASFNLEQLGKWP